MKRKHTIWAGMCALGASLVLYTACDVVDELLVVENPEEIVVETLDDFNLKDVQVAGVVASFKTAYDSPHIEYGSMHTDEHLDGVNWEGTARQGQRILHWDEGESDQIFVQLTRSEIERVVCLPHSKLLRQVVSRTQRSARLLEDRVRLTFVPVQDTLPLLGGPFPVHTVQVRIGVH